MKPPKPIEVDTEELSDLKKRVAGSDLSEKDRDILQRVITAFIFMSKILAAKNTTIKRLRKMLFGNKSEKASKVLSSSEKDSDKSDQDPPDAGSGGGTVKKPKGHGRNSAAAYTGADRVKISHQTLGHADPCPECLKGKVYLQQEPGIIVRVRGTAPMPATIYELEKLRCNLCGAVFTAKAPEEAGQEKYDETARAIRSIPRIKNSNAMPPRGIWFTMMIPPIKFWTLSKRTKAKRKKSEKESIPPVSSLYRKITKSPSSIPVAATRARIFRLFLKKEMSIESHQFRWRMPYPTTCRKNLRPYWPIVSLMPAANSLM